MRRLEDGVTVHLDHDQSVKLAAKVIADCIEVDLQLVRRGMIADEPATRKALIATYEYLAGKPYIIPSANHGDE